MLSRMEKSVEELIPSVEMWHQRLNHWLLNHMKYVKQFISAVEIMFKPYKYTFTLNTCKEK